MSDNKTVYRGKDYPVHSPGPWSVTAGVVPDRKGRLIVEDCNGNPDGNQDNDTLRDS